MPIPQSQYERDVLKWILEAIEEGEAFLRNQFGYKDIEKSIEYIQGEQSRQLRPQGLSNFSINRLGKVSTDIVSSLTDIRAFNNYRTFNDIYKEQAFILNRLNQSWWINNFIDLKFGSGIQLAIPAGCSYLQMVWNQDIHGGRGDLDLIPRDCRDVIPIRPSNTISIQDWMGVCIRTVETVNFLTFKYPHLADRIKPDHDVGFHSPRQTSFSRFMTAIQSPVQYMLRGSSKTGEKYRIPGKGIYTVYLKDDSINQSSQLVKVGYGPNNQEYSWSYVVEPGEPIYPRGRCIVAAQDIIFYDGPNVYWHGRFPLIKLNTDLSFIYNNSFLSKSVISDLIPVQDVINEIVSGIMDAVNQALSPTLVYDVRAIPRAKAEALNVRRPGLKVGINPVAGEGIKWKEPPLLPPYVFELLQFMIHEVEFLSGSVDLANLARVKQLPAAESTEALMQSMSPSTRLRGRLLEYALRELGEMVKMNFLQFYDIGRRLTILGPDGLTFEDFDFDPGTIVPDGAGRFTSLDKRPIRVPSDEMSEYEGQPRMKRAIKHSSNFSTYITPNSALELALVSEKAKYMMLRRQGDIDWETFMERLEIPNIQEIKRRLSSELDQKLAQVAELTQGRAGRPPTAQQSPQILSKDQGGRGVLSESGS